jgi:ubiquinone biosynthesis protein UbiJ
MPEYRTPLPGILAAVLEGAVNRVLSLDDNSPQRLQRLNGRMLQLDLEGLGITLYFAFTERRVEVGTRSRGEPDTVISGTPTALFTMAVPEGAGSWASDASRVTITGDANLARDLERLFSQLDPDWEGGLSRVFGDVWGHQVAAGLRGGAARVRETAAGAGEMLDEYLERGQGPVVGGREFEAFSASVDELDETTRRIENMLDRLEGSEGDEA